MWVRLSLDEARGVSHFVGILLLGLAIAMAVPLATAVAYREWDPALDYVIGVGLAAGLGLVLRSAAEESPEISYRQALLIASSSWLLASFLGAVPLVLSGNYGSYLDALFETASGFTTSGLTLTQDLDHMAHAHNMWRHLTHLIGGQGIIVAAVSLAIGLKGGAFSLYLAEGRDERILPNVVHTARFIWFVTLVWIAFGTLLVGTVNVVSGMSVDRGFLHGLWLTVACYDTGGFAPQSQNALYYHNPALEFSTVLLMMAGMFNFNLHADIWRGDKGEVFQNLEARTMAGNMLLVTVFAALGMAGTVLFSSWSEVLRKGVYHIISAHSGTGHQTLYAGQWAEMGSAAFFAVLLAMAFGGMVSSTAGGIKALRVGLILKAVVLQIRQMLSPPSAVVRTKFHHMVERQVTPPIVASALMVFTLYMVTYITGGLIGAAYGNPLGDSLFESISAAANVGLSTGITSPTMPVGMKLLYMIEMWAGRFEFFTLLVLFFAVAISLRPARRR